MPGPRCIPLQHITDEEVGGKAAGLAKLIDIGLSVPPGFVIIDAKPDELPDDLARSYDELNAERVAVRSSAIGEDSDSHSFAGQYETILNVAGVETLQAAVQQCLRSLSSARAEAYRDSQSHANTRMCVVVQAMVPAEVAGVLFTADPTSGRRDLVVVDAVRGLGEALVSGAVTPDHYLLRRDGQLEEAELQNHAALLLDTVLQRLLADAMHAETAFGAPLDMEWAVLNGELHWLQARPITRLPADLNELDVIPDPTHVQTWCNIGEMMPGAVTPLTYSVTGHGVDVGMQRMYRQVGMPEPSDEPRYVTMQYGHLFLDLTAMAELAGQVAGADKAQMCLAVCGRDIAEVREPPRASIAVRGWNGARYANMLLTAGRHRAALAQLVDSIEFALTGTARELYASIDRELPKIWAAYEHHLISSSASGAMAPILLRLLAKNEEPTEAHHSQVASWLAGANDVESADIATSAAQIVELLAASPEAQTLVDLPPDQGHMWLQEHAPHDVRQAYRRYLQRHGHRAVRELELRQKEWAEDPSPLVTSLQSNLRGQLNAPARPYRDFQARTKERPRPPRRLRGLLRAAHASIRFREHTKSLLVHATTRFKVAYRTLGAKMATSNLLHDADSVFFLTHKELGHAVHRRAQLNDMAVARRDALDYQMLLRFPQTFTGKAQPQRRRPTPGGVAQLIGKPVSHGRVTGVARVVTKLAEASALQAGEILIAPITDVGWTPYFGLISGLACDAGSAVSHGAVVAREYGLPAVVDLRSATTQFKTGDIVTLDGDLGVLSLSGSEGNA